MKPRILVLMGGPDAERAVSIDSGSAVAAALRECSELTVAAETIDQPDSKELTQMVQEHHRCDCVFPVLHGRWGEGGPLQKMLEEIGIAFVGAGSRAAALAMDKQASKDLVARLGHPTPAAQIIQPGESLSLDPPIVLKPVDDGSSVDLRICHSQEEIAAAREHLHPRRGRLLAERYIHGREVTVGIVLDEPLPLIEIIPQAAFYDYEAKYHSDATRYCIDPELPPGVTQQCRRIAMDIYEAIGCRDLARVDVMIDASGPWFLEINTMPGFTSHSLVPMAAKHSGIAMPELCAKLVRTAIARARARTAAAL